MNNVSVNLHIFSLTNMSDSQKKKKMIDWFGSWMCKIDIFFYFTPIQANALRKANFLANLNAQ